MKQHLFSNRDLRILLIPVVIEQILNALMGTVDTMMVSNVSSSAISAVSLVDSINVLVIQVFSALAAGGTIICSQYMGQKDTQNATEAAKQLVFIIGVISVVLTVICVVFQIPILRLVFGQVEDSVMRDSETYFLYTALSFPYMGVAGAAISTLVSRIFCAVVVMWYLRKPKQEIVVRDYLKIRPHFGRIKMVLAVGIPTGIENGMFQFGKLAIQSTVSTLGTAAIAAQAMTNILENMNGIAAIGIGIGLMTIVGQCIGAGRKDEAIYYTKKLSWIAEIVVVISCALVYVLAEGITQIGGMEPESAKMCLFMMGWITVVKPIVWVLAFIPGYGMRAAGDVKFSMILSCISMWIFRVSLCVFLCRVMGFGPIAVWIGMFTDWTVRAIVYMFRFHSRKWLEHQVIH